MGIEETTPEWLWVKKKASYVKYRKHCIVLCADVHAHGHLLTV